MNISIDVDSDGEASVKLISGSLTRTKNISISSLIESLAANARLNSGLMPYGTIWFAGNQNEYSVLIEHPAFINKLNFGGVEYSIPFPRCLFKFSVRNKRINASFVACLSHAVISGNDYLYSFPFGNVYNDRRICWGGVELPTIYSPLALRGAISLFFSSGFNGDLFLYSGVKITPPVFSNLIDITNGKEKFDVGILNKTNENVNSFMV